MDNALYDQGHCTTLFEEKQEVIMVDLETIKAMNRPTINAEMAAAVLNCNSQAIRIQARTEPEKLGFPVIVMGHRVKIPRLPFIAYIEGTDVNRQGG